MLLTCRLKITFTFSLKLIISFLVQSLHHLSSLLIITSSQVRVSTPLPLWSCSISGLGPEGLQHNRTIPCSPPVWSPGNLLRVTLASKGNSASENLQRETQQPKCRLYETPNVAVPVNETGDVIARTHLYARFPTDAPYKNQKLFWFTIKAFLKRPVLLKYCWLLRPFSARKPQAKAVPSKYYFTHLTLKNARKGRWVISLDYCASHPWHFCAIGDDSCSKIWRPSGLTLRSMPYSRGMLRIPLRRIL